MSKYQAAVRKKQRELVLMYPFVLLGKIAGHLFRLKTRHRHFLFFPSADIGGSIKVNADITACIANEKPLIIFSKKPRNNKFLPLFQQEGVRIIDLHKYIDNKLYHFVNFFFRGVLASWINRAEHPVVFGGESLFFYKIIPHVKKGTKRIELCHLNTWFPFSLGFIDDMDQRIFSTPKIKRDVERQYTASRLPQTYYDRLLFIDNKIDIPALQPMNDRLPLQVLFVGRGAPQKRVHLIAAIAKELHRKGAAVHFSFVGDVEAIIPPEVAACCTLHGQITDAAALHREYQQADVLILTSAYEGLPLVVMDMMARGKVVLSTNVDGIPDYITDKENGLLITETTEPGIVKQGVQLLEWLIRHPEERRRIGDNAYTYTQSHFSKEVFDKAYRQLLL
ncbi:glycosyltransferase family 4 protein [Niabella drilacis]|uniref:Glycosyltransferase involved in cell wall bisynthesis n=1 Tax=Niabella drilacis (strain DSM 25811 / CCM 8410 / CCUG 62505 / LMG 26954 / E90) TaxID=1285928 RepID=A0A1G6ZFL2_NIADE|nr:glycosyltransferase family 4 protein [Niabella drilacis]SDE01241.1 Glycosyltransferase involved in cell wall bisynthesis [Niabella drilacis]